MLCQQPPAKVKDHFPNYMSETHRQKESGKNDAPSMRHRLRMLIGNTATEVEIYSQVSSITTQITTFCEEKGIDCSKLSNEQIQVITSLFPVFAKFPNLEFRLTEDIEDQYEFLAMLDVPKATSYIAVTFYGNIMLSHINLEDTSKEFRRWTKLTENTLPRIEQLFDLIVYR